MEISIVENRTPQVIEALLQLWEASVRATHDFLSESEIARIGAYDPGRCRASAIRSPQSGRTALSQPFWVWREDGSRCCSSRPRSAERGSGGLS